MNPNIFLSCQQTQTVKDIISKYETPLVKASCPKFNEGVKIQGVEQLNVPVYGTRIQSEIKKLFELDFFNPQRQLLDNLLKYKFDSFIQTKIDKVKLVVEEFKKRGVDSSLLKTFITTFKDVSIKNEEDWNTFLKACKIPQNYMEHLHVSEVLQLFGCDKYTAKEILETKYEDTTLGQYSVRWLSKALSAYKIEGCLTDVVNLIYAMTKHKSVSLDKSDNQTESDIVEVINHFKGAIDDDLLGCIHWWPDIFIHDCEVDDVLCRIIIKLFNNKVIELIQVPLINQVPFKIDDDRAFYDEDSKNAKSFRHDLM